MVQLHMRRCTCKQLCGNNDGSDVSRKHGKEELTWWIHELEEKKLRLSTDTPTCTRMVRTPIDLHELSSLPSFKRSIELPSMAVKIHGLQDE